MSRNLKRIERGEDSGLLGEVIRATVVCEDGGCGYIVEEVFNCLEEGGKIEGGPPEPRSAQETLESIATKYGAKNIRARGAFTGVYMSCDEVIDELNAMKIGGHAIVRTEVAGEEFGHVANIIKDRKGIARELDFQNGLDVFRKTLNENFSNYLDRNRGKLAEGAYGFLTLKD